MKKLLILLILLQMQIGLAQAACKITGFACSIKPTQESIKKQGFSCRLGICLPQLLIKQIYRY